MRALFVVISFILIFSVGCTTPSKNACNQKDWYEIGRTDGAKGLQEISFSKRFKSCSMDDKRKALNLYVNGRNEGLATYCRPKNALELGKLNRPYKFVCPPELEDEFLNNYKKGRQISKLSNKNALLESEIQTLQKKHLSSNDQSLLTEIQNRKSKIHQNKSKLKSLSVLLY